MSMGELYLKEARRNKGHFHQVLRPNIGTFRVRWPSTDFKDIAGNTEAEGERGRGQPHSKKHAAFGARWSATAFGDGICKAD
jgi:hypothetical protein